MIGSGNVSDFARKAGLATSTVQNVLNRDKSAPRVDTALAIAKGLGVPLDWLVDADQTWPPPASATILDQARDLLHEKTWSRFERIAAKHGGVHVALAAAIDWLADSATGSVMIDVRDDAKPDDLVHEIGDELRGEVSDRLGAMRRQSQKTLPANPPGNPGRQSDADDDAA